MSLIITWLVTSLSLFVISKIEILGVEIASFPTALWSAAVFGILNATLGAVLKFLAFPITFLTLGLFALVLNGFIFALAATLVGGFTLKNGFWSALFGAIALSVMNSLTFAVLGSLGIV